MTPPVLPTSNGTEVEAIARTPIAQMETSARSVEWATRLGLAHAYLDLTGFCQPQLLANGKPMKFWPRPDIAGRFDVIPFLLDSTDIFPSPGSDHQFDKWTPGKWVDSAWGAIGPFSPLIEIGNRLQAELWNEANHRPAVMAWDGFAWSMSRTPFGAAGNGTIVSPSGIPIWATVPRADEVLAGHVGHALPLTVPNPMGGPVAPRSVRDIDDPLIGTQYKAVAAPGLTGDTAGIGWPNPNVGVYAGFRAQYLATDAQIAAGCKTMKYKAPLAAAVMTLLNAAREFGVIVSQIGHSTGIPLDGNPATFPTWAKAGITGAGVDLFAGMPTGPTLWRVVRSAVSVDADGNEWRRDVAAAHCHAG